MQRSWFHQWLRRLSRSQAIGRCGYRPPARLQIETLEARLTPDVSITNINGVLTVNCLGSAPNQVILDHSGSQTLVNNVSVADSSFTSIAINGNVSRNTLLLRTTVKRVEVNAGTDQTNITVGLLTNQLTQQAPINIHSTSGLVFLTINDQGTPTTQIYTLSATSFTRNGGGVNPVNWSGNSLFALTVNTGANTEFVTVNDTAFVSTVVNAGPSNDQIVVAGTSTGKSLTVNAGAGNDSVIFAGSGNRLANAGNVAVNGQGGSDQLILDDSGLLSSTTYTVTATTVSRAGIGTISYAGISFLRLDSGRPAETINIEATGAAATQINAGPAGDLINVHGSSGNLTVNAGGGTNTVNVGSAARQLAFTGTVTVNGQGGATALNVNDQNLSTAETYTLTGTSVVRTNSPGILTYSGLTALTVNTGTAGETVNVTSTSATGRTTVNTGPGGDLVTVSGFQPTPLAVDDASAASVLVVDDSALVISQSYTVTASFLSRTSAAPVFYSNLASVQLFTSQAADTVALNSTPTGTDIQVFTDSDGNTFRMGPGVFDGTLTLNGSGTDKLDYSSYQQDVYVNLQTGEATNLTAVGGIRDVTGGHGNNILVGDGHGNTLINPGPGRSLLIAGGSDFSGQGDTLIGGSDDDILIAGFTDYDLNRGALMAIMAEWTSPAFYADRVAALTTGNGVPLLDATTVHSNGGNNVLIGNAGFDLFFANPDNDKTDADPEAEVVVAIF